MVGTAQALAPAALVIVLVLKMGYVAPIVAVGGGALLFVLALVRGVAEYRRLLPRLLRFSAEMSEAGLTLSFTRDEVGLTWSEIDRVTEVPGRLGGLRIFMKDGSRFDLPQGGASFGALRAEVAARVGVEAASRRGRAARFVLGVVVVLAIFFVPFALDDLVGRSRVAALALVAIAWVALVAARRR
jgi:hypothetical protein